MVSSKKAQFGIMFLLIAAALMFYTGCGGDDKKTGLVGKWDFVGAEGIETPFDMVLYFYSNGTGRAVMNEGTVSEEINSFTWSTSGNQLIITSEGDTETLTFTLNGNTLTLDSDGEYPMQFTRV